MRTTLKIETANKVFEVELKLVNGRQIVELELADLLTLIEGKKVKSVSSVKPIKSQGGSMDSKFSKANTSSGKKRGRKPKNAEKASAVSMLAES